MLTSGTLLDGRVDYQQPAKGFRTGIEPVLLAASVPARAGERVLEAGAGAGAASLCLLARVRIGFLLALERDPFTADVAARNLRAQGGGGTALCADVDALPVTNTFNHAMANPPWHAVNGTASAEPRRDAAKRGRPDLYASWAGSLAGTLRPRGTLTLILPSAHCAAGLAALNAAGCGSPVITPLWPRIGVESKIVILRAVRGGAGPCRIHPGLVLHEADGRFTAAAERVLRGGEMLG